MEHKDYAVMYIIMEEHNYGGWEYLSDDESYDDPIVVCKTREDAEMFIKQLDQKQADEFMDYLDEERKYYGKYFSELPAHIQKDEWELARPEIYRIEKVPYYQ